MTTLDELKAKRQPNREAVEAHKQRMLAQKLEVNQARVSSIERGNLAQTQVSTLQRYVAALGGKLQLIAQFGDESVRIA